MSLKDRIRKEVAGGSEHQKAVFNRFGVVENPFPAAGQPFGHPRLENDVDEKVVSDIQEFETSHKTQVLVIEGSQGVGKTNLLNYYQNELKALYQDDKTCYIIRYYPDPEPSFDAIIRRVFQELGENHLRGMARNLNNLSRDKKSAVIDTAKNHELRLVLRKLAKSAESGDAYLEPTSETAMEWLLGLRVLNKHKELGVRFRLDTVESKTQVLRDVVYVSVQLETLRGVFLLLDELEKQDYSLSTTPVVRYLSAIRALIDALPTHLFLMMALTPDARLRYFKMLPAIAGRLQNVYTLSSLKDEKDGLSLYNLYLAKARENDQLRHNVSLKGVKLNDIIDREEIIRLFKKLLQKSAQKGIQGVTQRDFLNELYLRTQDRFKTIPI